MESWSLGFFVVPAVHLDELVSLHERWEEAFDGFAEDHRVRCNALYRRAAELAIERREFSGIAAIPLNGQLRTIMIEPIVANSLGRVFPAAESRAILAALPGVEKRLGGEAGVVRRIARRHFVTPPETIGAAYRACKDMLGCAADRDALFFQGTLDDRAEAELAAKQEDRERSAARQAARSPEEIAAQKAQNDEIFRQMQEDPRAFWHELVAARLHLLADADIPDLQELARRTTPDRSRTIAALAEKRALHTIVLDDRAEASGIEGLGGLVGVHLLGAWQPGQVYSAAQARVLHESVERWEAATGGEARAIERLARKIPGRSRTTAARTAYRAFRDTLARAAEQGVGLVLIQQRERVPATSSR